MPAFPRAARLAPALLLLTPSLAGCCWDACLGSPGEAVVACHLSADTLGGRGFTRRELHSLYVVEYADNALRIPRDTVRVTSRSSSGLVLFGGDGRLFKLYFVGDSLRGRLSAYRIVVPAAGRQFTVRGAGLDWVTSRQCRTTCEEVRGVRFTFNGQPVAQPQAVAPDADALELRR